MFWRRHKKPEAAPAQAPVHTVRDDLAPEARDLTQDVDPAATTEALTEWDWLDLKQRTPILRTLFGDLFLAGPDGVKLLNVVTGALDQHWDDTDALVADLATKDGQEQHLRASLVRVAASRLGQVDAGTSYALANPPSRGGTLDPGNLTRADAVASLARAGSAARPR